MDVKFTHTGRGVILGFFPGVRLTINSDFVALNQNITVHYNKIRGRRQIDFVPQRGIVPRWGEGGTM